jgi:hypothetical protein
MSKVRTLNSEDFRWTSENAEIILIIAAANHKDVMSFVLTFEMTWKDILVVGPPLGCEDVAAGFIRTSRCRTTPLFQPPALGVKAIDKQQAHRFSTNAG